MKITEQQLAKVLRPFEEGAKKGFADAKGNIMIAARYDDVDVFREDVCWVKTDGLWGLIDRTGRQLIEPRYEDAREYNDGLANVKTGGKWGVVDKEGRMAIRPEFDYIDSFNDGVAYVKRGEKYGFVFLEDNRIIEPVYDDVRGFAEGYAAVRVGKKWGYIDREGHIVIEPQYDMAGKFRDGVAYVHMGAMCGNIDRQGTPTAEFDEIDYDNDWTYEDEPWWDRGVRTLHGYVDREGRFSVKPKFRAAFDFDNGYALVRIDRKWAVIDRTGAYVVEPQKERPEEEDKHGDRSFVQSILINDPFKEIEKDGKTGIADSEGNIVIAPEYERIFQADDFFLVRKDGKWGAADQQGRMVIEPVYESVIWNKCGIFSVEYGDSNDDFIESLLHGDDTRWGIIDAQGHTLIEPTFSYKDCTGFISSLRFEDGLAPVYVDGKWGYVDTAGRLAIEPTLDSASEFENGRARIETAGKCGIIDPEGRYAVKPEWKWIQRVGPHGGERYYIVTEGTNPYADREGIVDDNGNTVKTPGDIHIIGPFNEGMARMMTRDERFGLIDCRTGRTTRAEFDFVQKFHDGLAAARILQK